MIDVWPEDHYRRGSGTYSTYRCCLCGAECVGDLGVDDGPICDACDISIELVSRVADLIFEDGKAA